MRPLLLSTLLLAGCLAPRAASGPEERKAIEGMSPLERAAVAVAPRSVGGEGQADTLNLFGPYGAIGATILSAAGTLFGRKALQDRETARKKDQALSVVVDALDAAKAAPAEKRGDEILKQLKEKARDMGINDVIEQKLATRRYERKTQLGIQVPKENGHA